ncbi:MAG: VOC family protein [Pseudomonadota bacterium]
MIDHVSVPVSNLVEATKFYQAVMATLGISQLVSRNGTSGFGKSYPEFWLNARPDMSRIPSDFGAHVCLRGPSKETIIAFHETALAHGGADAGAPGDRDAAQTSYFGAFIFDLDGNRIEAVTFPRNDTA